MTAGYYAPLPPARTGVADYAAALLTELRRHGNVEVSPAACGVALYHLGNNPVHSGIYRRALERPGVVVLHDAVLHHLLLGMLDERAYVEEFVHNYGEWNRGLAMELWRQRAASAGDSRYFAYPMLRRALEGSLAVVAHNPEAAAIARQHAPGARVVEIPHFFEAPCPPPSGASAMRFRQRLGVAPHAFLFGVFGHLRESKRLIPILETFAGLRRENSRVALLVAGDFVSSDLERAAAPLLASPGVARVPFLSEAEFWIAASAVDACINLRDPSAGETSGIAIRLMGLGKPVLLSDSPAWKGIPEDACIRVARGAAERDSLREHLRLLTLVSAASGAIGQRAAAHIQGRHRLEEAGRLYWELLCDYAR